MRGAGRSCAASTVGGGRESDAAAIAADVRSATVVRGAHTAPSAVFPASRRALTEAPAWRCRPVDYFTGVVDVEDLILSAASVHSTSPVVSATDVAARHMSAVRRNHALEEAAAVTCRKDADTVALAHEVALVTDVNITVPTSASPTAVDLVATTDAVCRPEAKVISASATATMAVDTASCR